MTLDDLRALADEYFEWPIAHNKSTVTMTSALLFAQYVLKLREQSLGTIEKSLGTASSATTPALRTAAQQALEALDSDNPDAQLRAAITLRAALAQPAPEPVAWLRVIDEAMVTHHLGVADPADDYEAAKRKMNSLLCLVEDIGAYFASSPQQPAPEPVANTTTLRAMLECCLSWEPNACVLGNVTARQAVIALRAALAKSERKRRTVKERLTTDDGWKKTREYCS